MKIEYVSHSAFIIEAGGDRILTDPWIQGSAYCNQWHLFPKPINVEKAQNADYVLITHGHEDHLHHESLLTLNKNACIFFPFQWHEGIEDYFKELGFSSVIEAISHKSYKLKGGATVTYIANSLDSIIVIEHEGEVFVNINDALPATHINVINAFLKKIGEKWPKIDYLFSAYASASYFPNTIHCEGKNDIEVAEAREQLFINNFCHIVNTLKPKYVTPCAADTVLLNNHLRWINRIKYTKDEVQRYYEDIFKGSKTIFFNAESGDTVDKNGTKLISEYHKINKRKELDNLIDSTFVDEIIDINNINYVNETKAESMIQAIVKNASNRALLYSKEILSKIKFTIKLNDVKENNLYYLMMNDFTPIVKRVTNVPNDSILTIETTSTILDYSFASDWGGDAIVIGYGAEIYIKDLSIVSQSLDLACVRLLTNQPVATKQMKQSPLRAAKYLITNPLTTSWAIKQLIVDRNKINKNPVNDRNVWLNKSKCEVCQACNIPYLTHEFSQTI